MHSQNKKSYKFFLKVVLIVILSLLVITTVAWIFFRSTARNIGYYLTAGRKNSAVILLIDYLGDPPSRFKARILSKMYGIAFEYEEYDIIKWTVGRPYDFFSHEAMPKIPMEKGRSGWDMMQHSPMMQRKFPHFFVKRVILDGSRVLTIYFPVYPERKIFFLPIILFFSLLGMISVVIYYALRKTLNPIDEVITAAENIGNGNLSYRMPLLKNSEFRHVSHAFNTMAEKLGRILSDQRQLLHLVSHELRTPLTRINLALEMKDKKRSGEVIRREVDDMNLLIEKILELSRLDQQEAEKIKEKVNISELLQSLIANYPPGSIDYINNSYNAIINGYAILLKKALSNLIDNAFKYRNSRDQVRILLFNNNSNIVVQIENSGKGIGIGELRNVFKPFFRGTNAQELGVEGKGLGLAIVKRIIEMNSGNITINSSDEGPTKVIVILPGV